MTVEYTVIEKVPSAEAFCHLRVAAGMSPRPLEGARAGLPHSCYGVHILWQETPPLTGPTLRWWRMCRSCMRSSALKAFGRKAKGWPASGVPGVVNSRFLPGKERCPNGNSSCGAFLTMLNAIHIARIP